MTDDLTKAQWRRRALKAEAELDIIKGIRNFDNKREIDMARELALCRVAMAEIKNTIIWALDEFK
jgi:hypothetical protein